MINNNKIILPGEELQIPESITQKTKDEKLNITQQFAINKNKLKSKVAGQLFEQKIQNEYIFAIKNYNKKYKPETEDFVIGIIKRKIGENYIVDINASLEAKLGIYEFEGATKKNKPNLINGTLIYARIIKENKNKILLSCISLTSKKEWVTGEAFFGELKNGTVSDFELDLCKSLLQKDPFVFNKLQNYIKTFEICVGSNGRIWINAENTKQIIVIMNVLKMIRGKSLNEIDNYVKQIVSFLDE